MPTKSWTVEISIDEQGDDTRATAVLKLDTSTARGTGVSRRNPADESVPQIGDELAVARALSDLAHQLLEVAAHDIESRTHTPASLDL